MFLAVKIRKVFQYLGSTLPGLQAHQAIRLADANDDGAIDMSEISDLLRYAYNLGHVVR
ncbi:hypothetical protein P3X46_001162 [Hevea brasiliensis]|uniref:EF-hand domain-containing protein n=1 Tax=Hevea brasiliensis TaxID=3981 RepID=A0ABQ9NCC6_HEVBR|nr:hypothetical protein P3X46_001162 [Hevea brasiliensis]